MSPRGKGALGQPEHCSTLLGMVVQLIKHDQRRKLVFFPDALILHFHFSAESLPFILYSPVQTNISIQVVLKFGLVP